MKFFEKMGEVMVYFQGVAPYLSLVNFALLLATFKQTFKIDISVWVIVPAGLVVALLVGLFDYTFILPHRIKRANRQNDIKQDVKDIIHNQELIMEKL